MIRIQDLYGKGEENREEKKRDIREKEKVEEKELKIEKEEEERIDFEKEIEEEKIIEDLNIERAEVIYNQGILLLRELFENIKLGKLVFPQGLIEVLRFFKDNLKEKGEILFFIFEETPKYYLIAHSLNTAILSMKMLLELGKDELEMLAVGVAACVHDVGMVNLMNLINRNRKLTDQEYMKVKEHSVRGYELVKNMEGLGEATKKFILPIVRNHHERFNGKGYPDGLKGKDIPFYVRLFGIVDIFEALSHSRPYRDALIPSVAVQRLIKLEGDGWFDYEILKTFIDTFSFYPIGSKVKLNTDEVAIVFKVNKGQPTRPWIKIIEGENKGKIKNLLTDPFYYIREGLK